jgi:metal-responsive CopG/Arc/MetJ family transcriptional regulator
MKDKRIYIRISEEFLEKLEYLMRINGFKNLSETIRKIIEKEYRKEKENETD